MKRMPYWKNLAGVDCSNKLGFLPSDKSLFVLSEVDERRTVNFSHHMMRRAMMMGPHTVYDFLGGYRWAG